MNTVCIEDATALALIYNYEATHSISKMLRHSQIQKFAEAINFNLQQLSKEIWPMEDADSIYFNSQDEDGNWYSILKPDLDIEKVKHSYIDTGSFYLWVASQMPNALEKINIESVNGKMKKIEKERQKYLSLV